MRSSTKRWTPSEVNKVARLIEEGKRPDQIAEDLSGRTPAAISNLIYKDESLLKLYQANRGKRTLKMPRGDLSAHGRLVKQSSKKLLDDLSEADREQAGKSEKKIVMHFADLMSAISAVASVLTLAAVLLALMA